MLRWAFLWAAAVLAAGGLGYRPDVECEPGRAPPGADGTPGDDVPVYGFPADKDNAARIRRKSRFIHSFESTPRVPVLYLNGDSREMERLMMEHALGGAEVIATYEDSPPEVPWRAHFRRVRAVEPGELEAAAAGTVAGAAPSAPAASPSAPPSSPQNAPSAISQFCRSPAPALSSALALSACWRRFVARAFSHAAAVAVSAVSGDEAEAALILEDDVVAVVPGVWQYSLEDLVAVADIFAAGPPPGFGPEGALGDFNFPPAAKGFTWEVIHLMAEIVEEDINDSAWGLPPSGVSGLINAWKAHANNPFLDSGSAAATRAAFNDKVYIISRAGMRRALENSAPEKVPLPDSENESSFTFDCDWLEKLAQAAADGKKGAADAATLDRACPGKRPPEFILGPGFDARLVRAQQMFSYNAFAADRSIERVLATGRGKERYKAYVHAVQQQMEHYFLRIPTPGSPFIEGDELAPEYRNFVWNAIF